MGPAEDSEDLNKLRSDYKPNRATRRRRLSASSWFTKATHSFTKKRSKNAPTKQQRQRAIAIIRKARKESYSKVTQE